jgi:hypothetical protein
MSVQNWSPLVIYASKKVFKIAHCSVSTRRVISVARYDKCQLLTLLVVKDDIQEGAMNLQAAVVANEAQLPKLVHEETHPGPRRPDHLGQGFLTDPRNDGLMLSV